MIKFSFCFGWWKFKRCVSIKVYTKIHNKETVLALLLQLQEALRDIGVKSIVEVGQQ